MSELKPCPFCGGHAVIVNYIDERDDYWSYIYCEGCGFESAYFVETSDDNMVDIWNRRVADKVIKKAKEMTPKGSGFNGWFNEWGYEGGWKHCVEQIEDWLNNGI